MQQFPFCPNPECAWHTQAPKAPWAHAKGSYLTKAFGRVPRYQCPRCHSTFSVQTFRLSYYLKRPIPLEPLLSRFISGESLRAISRACRLSLCLISNRLERLSRQAIALHSYILTHARLSDDICIDGFVAFETSQFFPSDIPIAITAHSQFVIDLSHASRRRSGTMTASQKTKARALYQHIPLEHGALARAFREPLLSSLRVAPPRLHHPFVLITDENPLYPKVLSSLPLWHAQTPSLRIVHCSIWSKLPRTTTNPLFASNYIDREIRKDLAHYHRQTTCFPRNVPAAMLRLSLYLFSHNYLKPFRIAHPSPFPSHAHAAGIPSTLVNTFLPHLTAGMRIFLSHLSLSPSMHRTWTKAWKTPGKTSPEYVPRFVLA